MPSALLPDLVSWFHARRVTSAWAVTGGGTSAVAALFQVPGASAGVLEVQVPYSAEALADYLGTAPERACAPETARVMAVHAFERARTLHQSRLNQSPAPAGKAASPAPASHSPAPPVWGVGLTAALVSDRPKRGEHRAHWAVHGDDFTLDATLRLEKGARDRAAEDEVVARGLLATILPLASSDIPCPLTANWRALLEHGPIAGQVVRRRLAAVDLPDVGLRSEEAVEIVWAKSAPPLVALRSEGRPPVWFREPHLIVPAHELPVRGLLCGSFNPLHHGHKQLRRLAEVRLGGLVGYELSIRNVAKPPLDYLTLVDRVGQFDDAPVVISSAPTFAEKSGCFPGVTFVIGEDTFVRVLDPRYHGGTWEGVTEALHTISRNGCRFLVAGRDSGAGFRTLDGQAIPAEFADLFEGLSEAEFRVDASSTRLRREGHGDSAD